MNRTITVKGMGSANAKPDYISLSMYIKAQDIDYEKTMDIASNQLEDLQTASGIAGFDKEALKTVDFNVQPMFEDIQDKKGNYKREFCGYVCSHALKIGFDMDMDLLSRAIRELSKCVSKPEFSIKFTVKDINRLRDSLLESATQNALSKARMLCNAADVELGELVTIDYSMDDIPPYSRTSYSFSQECNLARSLDIQPDDVIVRDTVTFIWKIKSKQGGLYS